MADLDEHQYSMDVPEDIIAAAAAPHPESPARIVSHETVPVIPKEAPARVVHAEDVAPAPSKALPPKQPSTLKEKVAHLASSRQNSRQSSLREAVSLPADGRLSELILPGIPHKHPPAKQTSHGRSGKSTPNKEVGRPASDGALPPISKSKIPSASPSRIQRASPGRSRIPLASSPKSEGASVSPPRDMSPGSWNLYSKDAAKPRSHIAINGPSDEERQKRRQWALEKRRREEAKARAEAERQALEDARRREADESKLEARRASIRERIQKQHEIAAKLATERQAAEERAKAEMDKFIRGKPLYEKLMEDYESNRKLEEQDRKKQYDEEVAKMKNVRPHQIMNGEVVVKPPAAKPPPAAKDGRDQSAGRMRKPSNGREKLLAGANSIIGDGFDDDTDMKAVAVKPQRRERLKPTGRGPEPPPALYSRNLRPLLMERAVSPFVFNSEQQPVNVPDQAVFWKNEAPQILAVQAPALPSVRERAVESPNPIDEIEMGDDVLLGADDDTVLLEHEVVAAEAEEGVIVVEGLKEEEVEAEVAAAVGGSELEQGSEAAAGELQQPEEQEEQEVEAAVAAAAAQGAEEQEEQEEELPGSQPDVVELALTAAEEASTAEEAAPDMGEEELLEGPGPSEEAAAAGDETFLTTAEPEPGEAAKNSEGAEAGEEAPEGEEAAEGEEVEAPPAARGSEHEAPEGGAEPLAAGAAAAGGEEEEKGDGGEPEAKEKGAHHE